MSRDQSMQTSSEDELSLGNFHSIFLGCVGGLGPCLNEVSSVYAHLCVFFQASLRRRRKQTEPLPRVSMSKGRIAIVPVGLPAFDAVQVRKLYLYVRSRT